MSSLPFKSARNSPAVLLGAYLSPNVGSKKARSSCTSPVSRTSVIPLIVLSTETSADALKENSTGNTEKTLYPLKRCCGRLSSTPS